MLSKVQPERCTSYPRATEALKAASQPHNLKPFIASLPPETAKPKRLNPGKVFFAWMALVVFPPDTEDWMLEKGAKSSPNGPPPKLPTRMSTFSLAWDDRVGVLDAFLPNSQVAMGFPSLLNRRVLATFQHSFRACGAFSSFSRRPTFPIL